MSMGFSRQEYWSGLHALLQGIFPSQRSNPRFLCLLHWQMSSLPLVAQTVKNLPAMWETWVQSLGRKVPWRREWLLTPVFLPEESHGQKSLAGYSRKESDTTERLTIKSLTSPRVPLGKPMWLRQNAAGAW